MSGLCHGLIEFEVQDVECWGQASDAIVCEKGERATEHSLSCVFFGNSNFRIYTELKATCFFQFWPSQRVIRIAFRWAWDQDDTVALNPSTPAAEE